MSDRNLAPMGAVEIAGRVSRSRPFIPSRYAALRTEAVEALRRAVEGFCDADDRKLGRAICDGQQILKDIDQLWLGS